MSAEYPNWRQIYTERTSAEVGQALSRRILKEMFGKFELTRAGLYEGNFEIDSDYDRLSLLVYPLVPDFYNHVLLWDSDYGVWQRAEGIDYEVFPGEAGIKINRVAMLHSKATTFEEQSTMIDAGVEAKSLGLTKVDRQEAKDLLKLIRAAEPLD